MPAGKDVISRSRYAQESLKHASAGARETTNVAAGVRAPPIMAATAHRRGGALNLLPS
jgi:hypothetical protein